MLSNPEAAQARMNRSDMGFSPECERRSTDGRRRRPELSGGASIFVKLDAPELHPFLVLPAGFWHALSDARREQREESGA
jgi:hypothetical protein